MILSGHRTTTSSHVVSRNSSLMFINFRMILGIPRRHSLSISREPVTTGARVHFSIIVITVLLFLLDSYYHNLYFTIEFQHELPLHA